MAEDHERLKLVRNEATKLTATYINGVAIAVLAVGGLAPIFAQKMSDPPSLAVSIATGIMSLVCLAVSGILHWAARNVLKGLQ